MNENERLHAEIEKLTKERDHWHAARRNAIAAGEELIRRFEQQRAAIWKQGYRQGRASATGKAEDFEALADMVRGWATERQIIPNSTPTAQLLKTMSELGELADATTKNSKHEITDGVGDVLVCLINYCALQNIDPVVCLHEAYNQIKDRKGTLLPSGVFVKENQ